MSFADIESAINTACTAVFANCTATMNGQPITGVFDSGPVFQSVGGIALESTGPQFRCLTADIPAPPNHRAITINGAAYTVTKPEPDGTGMSTLQLHKA